MLVYDDIIFLNGDTGVGSTWITEEENRAERIENGSIKYVSLIIGLIWFKRCMQISTRRSVGGWTVDTSSMFLSSLGTNCGSHRRPTLGWVLLGYARHLIKWGHWHCHTHRVPLLVQLAWILIDFLNVNVQNHGHCCISEGHAEPISSPSFQCISATSLPVTNWGPTMC